MLAEHVYSNFFSNLYQEHSSCNSRLAWGQLVVADHTDGVTNHLIRLTRVRGKLLRKHGFTHCDGAQYLYPEEAFYLCQSGSLQVYDRGLPLSFQQLCNAIFRSTYDYACCIAYTQLTRLSFVVRRRSIDEVVVGRQPSNVSKIINTTADLYASNRILDMPENNDIESEDFVTASPACNPLLQVKCNKSTCSHSENTNAATPVSTIVFEVFDDRTKKFRKRQPTEPDFLLQVAVLQDGFHFPPSVTLRKRLGPSSKITTLLAIFDGGDIYFQCVDAFSIPHINYS